MLAFEEAVGSNLEANNSHLSLRKMIRSGILNSLRISFDEGVFRCDSDMVFSYDELMQEEWYNFIKNNVTLINTIGLGCCISSKVDKRDIGYIIRTMGIKFSLKRPSRSAICDGKRKYFKDRAYQIDIKSIKEFIATLERRYNNRIHYENKYN